MNAVIENLLQHPFISLADRDCLPRLSAIYFVVDESFNVLYVGQTMNLQLRWKKHHVLPRLDVKSCILFYRESSQSDLKSLEKSYIFKLKPCLNKSNGTPIKTLKFSDLQQTVRFVGTAQVPTIDVPSFKLAKIIVKEWELHLADLARGLDKPYINLQYGKGSRIAVSAQITPQVYGLAELPVPQDVRYRKAA